jgi:hypothetical protein
MACKRCASENQSAFNGEVAIHFAGIKGLDKSIVWVFPRFAVCLVCGFAEFAVPERELKVLVDGTPVEGAVVLVENIARSSEKSGIGSPLSETAS